MNKDLLIDSWEYQKKLILAYGTRSEEANVIYKYCQKIFDIACKEHGYKWASEHLKPISLEDNH